MSSRILVGFVALVAVVSLAASRLVTGSAGRPPVAPVAEAQRPDTHVPTTAGDAAQQVQTNRARASANAHRVQPNPVASVDATDSGCIACVSVWVRDQYNHPQWSKRRPPAATGPKRST
jgi:hypothetical protein